MAKHRDDRERREDEHLPEDDDLFGAEEIEEIEEVDEVDEVEELEDVEDAEELEEVDDETVDIEDVDDSNPLNTPRPQRGWASRRAQPTMLQPGEQEEDEEEEVEPPQPRKRAKPTQIGRHQAPPTMLRQDDRDDLPGSELRAQPEDVEDIEEVEAVEDVDDAVELVDTVESADDAVDLETVNAVDEAADLDTLETVEPAEEVEAVEDGDAGDDLFGELNDFAEKGGKITEGEVAEPVADDLFLDEPSDEEAADLPLEQAEEVAEPVSTEEDAVGGDHSFEAVPAESAIHVSGADEAPTDLEEFDGVHDLSAELENGEADVLKAEEIVDEAEVEDAPAVTAGPGDSLFEDEEVTEATEAVEDEEAAEAEVDEADLFEGADETAVVDAADIAEDMEETMAVSAEDVEDDEATVAYTGDEATEHDAESIDLGDVVDDEVASGVDPIADALESGVELNAENAEAISEEDVDIESLTADEDVDLGDLSTQKKAGKTDDSDIFVDADAEVLDDEETRAYEDEEEAPRKKRRPVDDDYDDRRDRKPPKKPKYFRRWVGGFVLALILIGGAGAGLWYFMPDDLSKWITQIPASPNAEKPGVFGQQVPSDGSKKVELTGPQKARQVLNQGNYEQTIEMLKGDNSPDALALRGEALWFKYLKDQKDGAPVDPKASAIEEARKNLLAAKSKHTEMVLKEIDRAVKEAELRQEVAKLTATTKAADATRKLLADSKLMAADTDLTKLPEKVRELLTLKGVDEKLIADLTDALVTSKHLEKGKKLDLAMFKTLLADYGARIQTIDEIRTKLKLDVGAPVAKGVESMLAAKKDADVKLKAVDAALTDATIKDSGAKGVKALADARKDIQKKKDQLDTIIESAFKQLRAADVAPEAADPAKALVEATKAARNKLESPVVLPLSEVVSSLTGLGSATGGVFAKGIDMGTTLSELAFYKAREHLIQTPAQKLDVWTALLRDRGNQPSNLQQAKNEAEYIRSDGSKADPNAKGKALFVLGLIARNRENFDEAKNLLAECVKEGAALTKKPAWLQPAQQALDELTKPRAYFLPRIATLQETGDIKGAIAELDSALKVIPGDNQLLARRALLRLQSVIGDKAALTAAEDTIRKEAAAALKDESAAAEAYYVLGQLEEGLGKLGRAEKNYRAALKAHKGSAEEASRYAAALARVLLREPEPRLQQPAAGGIGQGPQLPARPALNRKQLASVLVVAMTGVQFKLEDENPELAARVNESIGLAKKLILSDNPKVKARGYMILGQAYAKQGERTKGLQEYVRGLQMLFPGREIDDLEAMIEMHPAFQQPDSQAEPNPFMANRHFGKGLYYYWNDKFDLAENEFKTAVGYNGQDARLHYFLGLARLEQGTRPKRESAIFSFEQGAALEAKQRSTEEVNASLERIQGPLRQKLDSYRLQTANGQ